MLAFSKETIDALARFEAKAKLVTAALRSASLHGWVNGRYVGVVK